MSMQYLRRWFFEILRFSETWRWPAIPCFATVTSGFRSPSESHLGQFESAQPSPSRQELIFLGTHSRFQVAVPNKVPTPPAEAIESALKKVTRKTPFLMLARRTFAARPPRHARKTNDATTMTGMRRPCGTRNPRSLKDWNDEIKSGTELACGQAPPLAPLTEKASSVLTILFHSPGRRRTMP